MTDMTDTPDTQKEQRAPSRDFLIRGTDYLKENAADFKLIGRQDDLDKTFKILMHPTKNNVLLTGLRGVGVSSMIYGLQAAKSDPNTPFDMVHKRYYIFETDRLFSQESKEDIEKGFKAALATLAKQQDSVLVVPDLGDFIDAATNAGCKHFINMLMHDLGDKSGNQAVFLCRDDNLKTVYNAHSDMHTLFTLQEIQEPSVDSLKEIVRNAADKIARRDGIRINPAAVDMALEMTSRYMAKDSILSDAQPGRTLALLENAMLSYRMASHRNPPELDLYEAQMKDIMAALTTGKFSKELEGQSTEELESRKAVLESQIGETRQDWSATTQKIQKLAREKRRAEEGITKREEQIDNRRDALKQKADEENARIKRMYDAGQLSDEDRQRYEEAQSFRGDIESSGYDMDVEIRQLKKEIDEGRETVAAKRAEYLAIAAAINSKLELDVDHVLSEFSKLSGIPANKLNQNEREKLMGLENRLNGRIYGQEPAIRALSDAVLISKSGLKEPNLPDGSFLFLGPSGTGKTESAKGITVELFDDERALIRINMSEYQEKNATAKLIGAPPGYEGFEIGGALTNAVRKNPYCVVLFDEIEKGHPDVMDLLLQILSDAELGDNLGRKVSFRNAIVILTSNIGSEYFLDETLTYEESKALAMRDLEQKYRPEFLNRFNGKENIIMFNRLGLPQLEKIANRELASLNRKVAARELSVAIDPADLKSMCRDFYAPGVGARRIPALFNSRIYPDIARTILFGDADAKGEIAVDYDETHRSFVIHPPKIVIANESDMKRELASGAAGGFQAAARPS